MWLVVRLEWTSVLRCTMSRWSLYPSPILRALRISVICDLSAMLAPHRPRGPLRRETTHVRFGAART